jgi:hypothetical protein
MLSGDRGPAVLLVGLLGLGASVASGLALGHFTTSGTNPFYMNGGPPAYVDRLGRAPGETVAADRWASADDAEPSVIDYASTTRPPGEGYEQQIQPAGLFYVPDTALGASSR